MREQPTRPRFSGVICAALGLVLVGCAATDTGGYGNAANLGEATHATPLSTPTGVAGAWQTVWQDEFDNDTLDATKWRPEQSCWGGGNNERQCYTDSADNVRVEDGMLHLIARRQRHTGPTFPDGMAGLSREQRTQKQTQAYTSGKVRTRDLAAWRYGRFSARMKLPAGQGLWPAFWMLPQHDAYGGWPLSGEIDIMEAVNLGAPCDHCPGGPGAVETRTSGAIHFGGTVPANTYWTANDDVTTGPGAHEAFKVYSVEWAQGVIQWLVDGQVFMRADSDDWYTRSPAARGRDHAPFDQPFYLMINLAVGGNLPERIHGGGFDPDAVPARVLVDWVRVEQCHSGGQLTATGLECLTEHAWDGVLEGPRGAGG